MVFRVTAYGRAGFVGMSVGYIVPVGVSHAPNVPLLVSNRWIASVWWCSSWVSQWGTSFSSNGWSGVDMCHCRGLCAFFLIYSSTTAAATLLLAMGILIDSGRNGRVAGRSVCWRWWGSVSYREYSCRPCHWEQCSPGKLEDFVHG